MSESAYLKEGNSKERNQLLAKAVNAKNRICIYGSNEVISALAKFEQAGASINSKESAKIFVNLCEAMRDDHLEEKNKASFKELATILVGPEHR